MRAIAIAAAALLLACAPAQAAEGLNGAALAFVAKG